MPIRKGKVGTSLQQEGAQSKFGSSAQTGVVGEKYFWKMITQSQLTYHYGIWASLGIPQVKKKGYNGTQYKTKKYGSDVDFAVANGDTIVLVDAKMYKGNKFYWSLGQNIMEGFGFKKDKQGNKVIASRNMAMAIDFYKIKLNAIRSQLAKQGVKTNPVKIVAITVFVPTTAKTLPTSVRFLTWPGGIKSYLPEAGVKKIRSILGEPQMKGKDTYINQATVQLLNGEVK